MRDFPVILFFTALTMGIMSPCSCLAQASLTLPPEESRQPGQIVQVQLPGGPLLNLCYCPPGSFTMGSPSTEKERQTHENQVQVKISKGFWLGQTELTHEQWLALKLPSGYINATSLNRHPEDTLTWDEAQGYVSRLNQTVKLPSGWMFALPTEAQWEYACRAGTTTPFHFGSVLNGQTANSGYDPYGTEEYGPNRAQTIAVGSFPPNAWGLYDMHGNASEWCLDGWDGRTPLPGGTDPVGDLMLPHHVRRGGNHMSPGGECRSASREVVEIRTYQDCSMRLALVPRTPDAHAEAVQQDFSRFPLLTAKTDAEGNVVFTEIPLNISPLIHEGLRSDGLRFRVERSTETESLVWAFKKPANLKAWGIAAAQGTMNGFNSYASLRNDYIIQGLDGAGLVTGQEYVLIMSWKDDTPVTLRAGFRFAEVLPNAEGQYAAKTLGKALIKTPAGLASFQ